MMTRIDLKRRKYRLLTMSWTNLGCGIIAGVLGSVGIWASTFIVMGVVCGVGYDLACLIEGEDE